MPNQYTKLLDIATKYGLLKVYEPLVPPRTGAFGHRIEPIPGKPKLVGPGTQPVTSRKRSTARHEAVC